MIAPHERDAGSSSPLVDPARLDWLRYLDGLDELVSAATDAVAAPTVERPASPLPEDLAARAQAALEALAVAELTLEQRLDQVRGELRASSTARRRAFATTAPASAVDLLA
jgi:hypothetical protein